MLWFEYCEIARPCALVGRAVEPPGSVIVNTSPGATESGAFTAYAMSTLVEIVCPARVAEHSTCGNTPCTVCAVAGESTKPTIANPSVANAA
jgi:hypothetical protein